MGAMEVDRWIKWRGGECPIDPKQTVEVRLRGGDTDTRQAGDLYWDYSIPACDQITAYKFVS